MEKSDFDLIVPGGGPAHFGLESLETRIVAQSESASSRFWENLKHAGVTTVSGKSVIAAPGKVLVETEDRTNPLLGSRFILVATGSEPVFSADAKPLPPRIFAPRNAASICAKTI